MRRSASGLIIVIAAAILSGSVIFSVIGNALRLNEEKALEAKLSERVRELTRENAALRSSVDSDADADAVMRVAREKLGLALPNERIFIDISN